MRPLGSSADPNPARAERRRRAENARYRSKQVSKALVPSDISYGGLAYAARALPGGRTSLIELARLSEHTGVQAVIKLWDELSPRRDREKKSLEILCDTAGIAPGEFLGAVVQAAFAHNTDVSKLVLAVNTPRVTQRAVKTALKEEGFRDREMLLQAAGIVPRGGGGIHVSTTAVANAKAAAAAIPQPGGLPTFEEDSILVSRAVEEEGR